MLRRPAPWLALFAALAFSACQPQPAPAPSASTAPAALPSPPPWVLPSDAEAAIRAAGLEPLSREAFTMHIHAHLDVFYNGERVEVPANVGIDPQHRFISPLHTHAKLGVLHVESATVTDFTLGQFFAEWGVPLTGAKAYVGGQPATDPAAIVLADKQQLAVVFGTPPSAIPSTYDGPWQ